MERWRGLRTGFSLRIPCERVTLMENGLTCTTCCCAMKFTRHLSFDNGMGHYNLYLCPECQNSKAIAVDGSPRDKRKLAQLSLRVMQVLNTLDIEEIETLVVDLESTYKRMN